MVLLSLMFVLVTGPTMLLRWLMARTLTPYRRWSVAPALRLPPPKYWPQRGECVLEDFRDKATIRDARQSMSYHNHIVSYHHVTSTNA